MSLKCCISCRICKKLSFSLFCSCVEVHDLSEKLSFSCFSVCSFSLKMSQNFNISAYFVIIVMVTSVEKQVGCFPVRLNDTKSRFFLPQFIAEDIPYLKIYKSSNNICAIQYTCAICVLYNFQCKSDMLSMDTNGIYSLTGHMTQQQLDNQSERRIILYTCLGPSVIHVQGLVTRCHHQYCLVILQVSPLVSCPYLGKANKSGYVKDPHCQVQQVYNMH